MIKIAFIKSILKNIDKNMVQILLYEDEEFSKTILKSSGFWEEIHKKYEKLKEIISESCVFGYDILIFDMFKLKVVHLGNLKLDTIPEELFDLKTIEFLSLFSNFKMFRFIFG